MLFSAGMMAQSRIFTNRGACPRAGCGLTCRDLKDFQTFRKTGCSPPDNSRGWASVFFASPTQRSISPTSARTCPSGRPAGEAQWQGHVVERGEVREQSEILEHDADSPAQERQPAPPHRCP
jgi:hypothetical protein